MHRRARDGYKSECKSCRRQYNHNIYQRVKDTPRRRQASRVGALRRYGLTLEAYEHLAVQQDGRCAICRRVPPNGKRLHVDHCHETNRVRGLLCIHCNRAIGSLGDNLAGVMRAVRYLQESPSGLPGKALTRRRKQCAKPPNCSPVSTGDPPSY